MSDKSWADKPCVLCGSAVDKDMGMVYKYKDAKYHQECIITELLKLKENQ
jgi:hypothetical protein